MAGLSGKKNTEGAGEAGKWMDKENGQNSEVKGCEGNVKKGDGGH